MSTTTRRLSPAGAAARHYLETLPETVHVTPAVIRRWGRVTGYRVSELSAASWLSVIVRDSCESAVDKLITSVFRGRGAYKGGRIA